MAEQRDDQTGLRGGTEGGRAAPLITPGSVPRSPDLAGTTTGPNRQPGRGTRNDAQDDPEAAFEDGTRKMSAAAAEAAARDEADVPPGVSRSGYNAGDPRQTGPDRTPPAPQRPA